MGQSSWEEGEMVSLIKITHPEGHTWAPRLISPSPEVGTGMSPVLQMRKLRPVTQSEEVAELEFQ